MRREIVQWRKEVPYEVKPRPLILLMLTGSRYDIRLIALTPLAELQPTVTFLHVYMSCMYECTYICGTHLCMYVLVHLYVCVYIHMNVMCAHTCTVQNFSTIITGYNTYSTCHTHTRH